MASLYLTEQGSVVRLSLTPDAAWVSLQEPATGSPTAVRFARFDPLTEVATDWTPSLAGSTESVRALASSWDTVWVAAGSVLARVTEEARTWRRWRIRPVVRLPLREEDLPRLRVFVWDPDGRYRPKSWIALPAAAGRLRLVGLGGRPSPGGTFTREELQARPDFVEIYFAHPADDAG